jgi:hypothetical protein
MGGRADWGSLKCGCHPNGGMGTILFVNKRTKEMVPVSAFLDLEQLLLDVQDVTDAGAQLSAIALLKNFRAEAAPEGDGFADLVRQSLRSRWARSRCASPS